MRVLVAADRLAGGPVQGARRLIRQRTRMACTVEAARPTRGPSGPVPAAGASAAARPCQPLGLACGPVSSRAAGPIRHPGRPWSRNRVAQRWAVGRLTWNRSAARVCDQPCSTMVRASRSRPSSLRGALRWSTRTSRVGVVLGSSTPDPEVLLTSTRHPPLHQPLWAVQLAQRPGSFALEWLSQIRAARSQRAGYPWLIAALDVDGSTVLRPLELRRAA